MTNKPPTIKMFRGFLTIEGRWSINIDLASTIVWYDWEIVSDDDKKSGITMYFPFHVDQDGLPQNVDAKACCDPTGNVPYSYVIFRPALAAEIRKVLGV